MEAASPAVIERTSKVRRVLLAFAALLLAFVMAMASAPAAHALGHVDNAYNKEYTTGRSFDCGNVWVSVFLGTKGNYTKAGQIKLTVWNNTKSADDNYSYDQIVSQVARSYTVTGETVSDDVKIRLGKTSKMAASVQVTSKPVQPNYNNFAVMIPLTIKVPAHYCIAANSSTSAGGSTAGEAKGVAQTGGARQNFYEYDADNAYPGYTLKVLEHEEKAHWETVWLQLNILNCGLISVHCDQDGWGSAQLDGSPTKYGRYYRHCNSSSWINLGLASEKVRLILGTKADYDAGKVYSTWSKWKASNLGTVSIGGKKYVYCEISTRKCLAAKSTTLPSDASMFRKQDVKNADGSVTKYSFDGWKTFSRAKKVNRNLSSKKVMTSHGTREGDKYTHCNQYGTTIKLIDYSVDGVPMGKRAAITNNSPNTAVYFLAKWKETTKENDKYTVHYWFSPTRSMDIDLYTNVENDGEYEPNYRYNVSAYATAMARHMIEVENKWLKYAATTYTCPDCGDTFTCPDASYQKGAGDNDTRNDHWKEYLAHVNSLSPSNTSYTRYSCSYCGSDSTSSHTHYVCVDWGSYLSCSNTDKDHTHTSSCYTDWEDWDYVNYCTAYTMYRYECPDCGYSSESKTQSSAYSAVSSHIASISRDDSVVGTLGAYDELTWDGTWWIGTADAPLFEEEWVDGTPLNVETTGCKNDLYLYANCMPTPHITYPVTLIVNPGTDGEDSWIEQASPSTPYTPSDSLLAQIEMRYGIHSEDHGRLVGWWYDPECKDVPYVPIGIGQPTTIYAYTEHYVYYGLTTRGWSLQDGSRSLYENRAMTTARRHLLEYNLGTDETAAFGGQYRRTCLTKYGETVEFDCTTTKLWFKAAGKKRSTGNSEGYYDSESPAAGSAPITSVKVKGTTFVYRDWAGGIYDGVYMRGRS